MKHLREYACPAGSITIAVTMYLAQHDEVLKVASRSHKACFVVAFIHAGNDYTGF